MDSKDRSDEHVRGGNSRWGKEWEGKVQKSALQKTCKRVQEMFAWVRLSANAAGLSANFAAANKLRAHCSRAAGH